MSDELRRRFQDKIQGRLPSGRRVPGIPGTDVAPPDDLLAGRGITPANTAAHMTASPDSGPVDPADPETGIAETASPDATIPDTAPPDSLLIRGVEMGPLPDALGLNPAFEPSHPRVRMTLELGSVLRDGTLAVDEDMLNKLLSLCPHLPEHECVGGRGVDMVLSGLTGSEGEIRGGLEMVHLIEHVAIELMTGISDESHAHGAICSYRERPDLFDLFLESADPVLGRSVAVLSAAIVRDLVAGRDRLEIHIACRDLLGALVSAQRSIHAPEDIAIELNWSRERATDGLDCLVRLGFLQATESQFTFSSPGGILYRRTPPDAPPD